MDTRTEITYWDLYFLTKEYLTEHSYREFYALFPNVLFYHPIKEYNNYIEVYYVIDNIMSSITIMGMDEYIPTGFAHLIYKTLKRVQVINEILMDNEY